MTPAQRLLGFLLREGESAKETWTELKEHFPESGKIPGLGPTEKAIFEALYEGGLCGIDVFDLRTSGAYHDAIQGCLGDSQPDAGKAALDELIREKARQIILLASAKAVSSLGAGGVDPAKVGEELETAVKSVSQAGKNRGWKEYVKVAREEYAQLVKHGSILKTGLKALDGKFMFRRRQMSIIAAPTSHGKTSFATALANSAIKQGLRVSMLCFEDYTTLPMKMAAQRFKKPLQWFTRYDLATEPQRVEVDSAMLELGRERSIEVYPPMRIGQFGAAIRKTSPDVVILDYVQRYAECYGGDEKRESCGRLASDFQSLVQELGAIGILCSQVRRRELTNKGIPRRPNLGDLKESGDLENYADAVLLLWWPWKDSLTDNDMDRERYHIEIAKDKLGECGEVKVRFDASKLSWRDEYAQV